MNNVLCVIGTRPEAVKMAPVIAELRRRDMDHVVLSTGQHRELVSQTLGSFGLQADIDLNLMTPGQTPTQVAARVLDHMSDVFATTNPEWMIVQGDTTTVMAAAIAGSYAKIKVAHLEAGLRTGDKHHPFPEELNRKIAAAVADLHLAPTASSEANLLREGIPKRDIHVTGNTVIDALLWARSLQADLQPVPELANLDPDKPLVLLTAHRRESFGAPLEEALSAIAEVASQRDIEVLYPVHPNPSVREPAKRILDHLPNVHLVEPLDYFGLVQVLDRATIVVTDSGGLQEEAPAFGKPVLVLRETTERPEAVDSGVARLLGTDGDLINKELKQLLDDPAAYAVMAQGDSPYGDGLASQRVVAAIRGEQSDPFSPAGRPHP